MLGACIVGILIGSFLLYTTIRKVRSRDQNNHVIYAGNFTTKVAEVAAQAGAASLFGLGAVLVTLWSLFYKHQPVYLIAAADMAEFMLIFGVNLVVCLTSVYQPRVDNHTG